MDQKDQIEANNQVRPLIGSQCISFGRAAEMAMICFKSGVLEYVLHLQCFFRVRDNYGILVTNTEMFEPSELALSDPAYSPDIFEWDVQGGNRYDEWAKSLNPVLLSRWKVIDAKVSSCGDLTILLDQGVVIEVFIDAIVDECWRFFEIGTGVHLVVTGSGLEI